MEIEIKAMGPYEPIFGTKTFTVGIMKRIVRQIMEEFGNLSVNFFFDTEGFFERYRNEHYFNGMFHVAQNATGINLCQALNSSESLSTLSELENMLERIPVGSRLAQGDILLDVTEDTIVRVGARQPSEPSGEIVEIMIIGSECFIFTSTYGIDWRNIESAIGFSRRTFNWFFKEYCNLSYEGLYHIVI